MSSAHLFVADIDAPVVDDVDRHHVERVLRIVPGEVVTVTDGAGGWRTCVMRAGLVLEPTEQVGREPRPSPELTVGFALIKGDRPEWTVQKLTECGVDRIIPFVSERGIVRWDVDKAARNVDRLRRVAREAAMQSRRRWLPNVVGLVPFDVAVRLIEPVGGALADVGPAVVGPPSLDRPAILVGPEGGWTEAERGCGLPAVSLGSPIFRAETAAVAAGVLLGALRSELVAERLPGESRVPRST
jgi:16S rRNA (uracil1498-N3)-methyltransferase